jgi:SAM-dependent methyltransferase
MRLPVGLQSLFIQCAAVLLTAGLSTLLQDFLSFAPALWQLALVQGALASGLSRAWRQPAWWLPLHAGFMPAVVLVQQASLPPWVYLSVFVLLLLFYWSSFRTRVPLFLSGPADWETTASLLPQAQAFRFIDLGSGLGGVPLHLAARFPQGDFVGTEVAPAPWLISRLRASIARSRARFLRRDYTRMNLGEFDVVFVFLSPAAMPALWQQAIAQMRPGSLLVSLAFVAEEGRPPDRVLPSAGGAGHTLYAWQM